MPCPAVSDTPQIPIDKALCRSLEQDVRRPAAFRLDVYERKIAAYLRNYCHRDASAGWKVDKRIRDTGPFIATFDNGEWAGRSFGTHAPVLVWYSAEMYGWLKVGRPEIGQRAAATPIPDGSMIIKEMYSPPAAACAGIDAARLQPDNGFAIMVRDRKASYDGWFWGWLGWSEAPDWPAPADNRYPHMGFGQYCTNCHASAKDNYTFAALRNIKGEPGEPLTFLSQNFFLDASGRSHHGEVATPTPNPPVVPALRGYDAAYLAAFGSAGIAAMAPTRDSVDKLPSETYDSVVMPPMGPRHSSTFVTSDQCIGCHDARGTGLQYDMTEPGSQGKLWNVSPYATWRTSSMGLSGRDPFFYAQLASEAEHFHRASAARIEDICLGCHGVGGQRQFAIDRFTATGRCETFSRRNADAVPFGAAEPASHISSYGALARDGVTCAACHHMVLGKSDIARYANQPQNACVKERQALLNPNLDGFARTFTGGFTVGSPGVVFGPFTDPRPKPMKNALGLTPEHSG
ncbi:MAG: cytochrome P460 family protein, partial [Methylobacteriaceae bacterium]|nr:cytochrome P460 family protein [Methylobacteriaceae bacterium]